MSRSMTLDVRICVYLVRYNAGTVSTFSVTSFPRGGADIQCVNRKSVYNREFPVPLLLTVPRYNDLNKWWQTAELNF